VNEDDTAVADRTYTGLDRYEADHGQIPGVRISQRRTVFVQRVVESSRRERFLAHVASTPQSPRRIDPNDPLFDPIRAAVHARDTGDLDEAVWLIFLAVHFGRHAKSGWQYTADVYGRRGSGSLWTWDDVTRDPHEFAVWMDGNAEAIRTRFKRSGFGNHRKRESLRRTSQTVLSYTTWVASYGDHGGVFSSASAEVDGDQRAAFDTLFESMDPVFRFGRVARFDYLTMLGRLHLASLLAGKCYIKGSSGPLQGGRSMFGAKLSPSEVESACVRLEPYLGVSFATLEDALCNWQKDPNRFKRFRG